MEAPQRKPYPSDVSDEEWHCVLPDLPPLADEEQGYLVTSLPASLEAALAAAQPRLRPFVRQRYRRAFTALDQTFEAFLAAFSAKSRSTLKRKLRRFAERSGGAIDLRCYRREERRYTPHVTLGRAKGDDPAEDLPAALLRERDWKGGECEVTQVRVLSSELRREGRVALVEEQPEVLARELDGQRLAVLGVAHAPFPEASSPQISAPSKRGGRFALLAS